MRRWRIGSMVVVGALAVGLATPTLAGSSTTAGSSGGGAMGDPIKVMTMGEFAVASLGSENPEVSGAVEARAKAINKAGGLEDANGVKHEVEVIVCNTNNDPNQAGQCARDAVEQGVVAMVNAWTTLASEVYPVLEAEGIASIGPPGSEPVQLSSNVSFPFIAGPVGAFFGMAKYLASEGAKRVALVYPDLPAAAGVIPLVEPAITAAGMTLVAKVPVPGDATDLAPVAAAATADGVDGIAGFTIGDQNGLLFQALKQSGYEGKTATASVFLTPDLLTDLGDVLDGLLVISNTTPSTAKKVPGIKKYLKDMNAFDKSLFKSDGSIAAWAAMWVFERVASTLPDITKESVLDAMGKLEDFDMGGIVPNLTTTAPFSGGSFDLPRLFNPNVVLAEVKGGKIKRTTKEFLNAFEK